MHIFVIGTGRSGTTWTGRILACHPQVRATIEAWPIFRIATQAALRPKRRLFLLPILRLLYTYEGLRSRPLHYADKSHPVIWYSEKVAMWFPDARFVAVERSPYGTVASMLQHAGVSAWQREWRRFGVPNEFLGIDRLNAPVYHKMSPAERAALRWRSHRDRIEYLRDALGKRLLVLRYETLIDDFESEISRLWAFLGLEHCDVSAQVPNVESREHWRERLSREEMQEIEGMTGVSPD